MSLSFRSHPSLPPADSSRASFTLIELLVVIAIIAILAIAVILTLNPTELLKQSRDANRLADMDTLMRAVPLYLEDVGGALGAASTTYLSIPDAAATSTAGDQCQGLGLPALPSGWSYHCASVSAYQNTDGTGWIPVNFKAMVIGAPIGALPKDPTNTTSSGFYYTYTPSVSAYALTATMESQKYLAKAENDGGVDPARYETGSNLALVSQWEGLVGWWTFDEGAGSGAKDSSGYGNNGKWNGTGTHWITGKVGPYAGQFASVTGDFVSVGSVSPLNQNFTAISAMGWVNANASQGSDAGLFSPGFLYGCTDHVGTLYCYINNGGNNVSLSFASYVGSWNLVSEVFDGNTIYVYIDAVLVGSKTSSAGSTGSGANLKIGNTSSIFNGNIDDVRIYSRALSPVEIQNIYTAEK